MENSKLQAAVRAELAADPKIDPRQFAVSADDEGVVTLRGTVGSLRQRRDAEQAAKRVYGVQKVENDLDVRLLIGDRRNDAVLRGEVLQALTLNSRIPPTVEATVNRGVVTLTGAVNWNFEREEAEATASNVRGVRGVRLQIVLTPTAKAVDVKEAIEHRLTRNAAVEAENIFVETSNGKVTLRGFVSSWAARDAAVGAAWSAPNVREVDDQIELRYPSTGAPPW